MPLINSLVQTSLSRTCDYSAGGIYMWIDFFGYEYCVVADTLFIKGLCESDRSRTAFCLPIGALPLAEAVSMIKEYCRENNIPLIFSAVPDDRLDALLACIPGASVEPLEGWADYLYDINSLATLTGKHLMKKRNHVNRFFADNPHWRFEPITHDVIPELILFNAGFRHDAASETDLYEADQCMRVLESYNSYPFEGALLRGETGEIVAFSIGEVIGDTIFVHIEKMRHDVPGAGAAICKLFSAYTLRRHSGLRWANREEDCGDPGLRHAKESYHPALLLHKFNVTAG